MSDATAKRVMLRAVLTTAEIRIFWRERTITADDVRAVLPLLPETAGTASAGRAVAMLKRSMLRVIERQVALRYTGETWDEVVAEEPSLAALNARRTFGRERGEFKEFGAYLADAFAARPDAVRDWLTRSFAAARYLRFPLAAGTARACWLRTR